MNLTQILTVAEVLTVSAGQFKYVMLMKTKQKIGSAKQKRRRNSEGEHCIVCYIFLNTCL